jgi:hypothetical protein
MIFECDSCRFSGNSKDTRIKNNNIYCQKAGGMVQKHIEGKCAFRLPVDISVCGQQAGKP